MASVAGLPAELLAHVAIYVSPLDIVNLRRTSKHIANSVNDAFIDRFFCERVHLYTRHSLEALRHIANDEIFRKKLSFVQILVPARHLRSIDISNEGCDSDATPEESEKTLREHWSKDRKSLHRELANIFEDALRNLSDAKIVPSISIQAYCASHIEQDPEAYICPPHGHVALRNQLTKLGIGEPACPEIDDINRTVLKSIIATSFPLKHLMLCDMYGISATTSTHTFEAEHFAPMLVAKHKRDFALKSTLSTLTVALQPSGYTVPAYPEYKGKAARANHAIDVLMSSCHGLEHLILNFVRTVKYSHNSHRLWPVERCMEQCKLQTLDLTSGIFPAEDLMSLLRSHKSSLRHLVLSGVHLENGDEWRTCLAWITQELNLESLALLELNTTHGFMCVNLEGEMQEIRVNLTGQAEITTHATVLVACMEEMELEEA